MNNYKPSDTGGGVGALIGALASLSILVMNSGEYVSEHGVNAVIVSVIFGGLFVGMPAGGSGEPWLGALGGAIMAGILFGVIIWDDGEPLEMTNQMSVLAKRLFWLQFILGGMLAGGIGGWMGRRAKKARDQAWEVYCELREYKERMQKDSDSHD